MFGFFDIHEYGTIVIDRLEEVEKKEVTNQAIPFSKLVENRRAHDISRLFLATLQLVKKSFLRVYYLFLTSNVLVKVNIHYW